MKCKKSLIAGALCSAVAFSTLSVSAEWVDAGYDTTTPPSYYKIQNEVLYGKLTSNAKKVPVKSEDVEWKTEGYELDYPHVGYDRLYLEGNAQVITRYNGLYPQWQTQFRDFMWELKTIDENGNGIVDANETKHVVWERQQTNIPGIGWRWDFGNANLGVSDFEVFVPTNKTETATVAWAPFGVGSYDMYGNKITDRAEIASLYTSMLGDYAWMTLDKVEGDPAKSPVDPFFSAANLSQKDENGAFAVTDEMIAKKLGAFIGAKTLTGRTYYGEDATKNVAYKYLEAFHGGYVNDWAWDNDVVKYMDAEISWTAPQFEMAEPYNYYQYLVINGLTFDGRNDTPRIFRFTGGKATPNVEWKYVFSEAEYPYNVIEVKYVDGVLAIDENTQLPIYRTTSEFGNAYFKVTSNEIQLWVKDERGGDVMVDSASRTDANYGGYATGYTNGANWVY